MKRFTLRTAIGSVAALAIAVALVAPRWLKPRDAGPLAETIARWNAGRRTAITDGGRIQWNEGDAITCRVALQTESRATRAAFSPEGRWLAGVVDNELVVWDSGTGRRFSAPTSCQEVNLGLPACAFSPFDPSPFLPRRGFEQLVVTPRGVAILTHSLGYTTIDLERRQLTRGRFIVERVTEQVAGGVRHWLTPDGRLVIVVGDEAVLLPIDDPGRQSRLPLHGLSLRRVDADATGRWLTLVQAREHSDWVYFGPDPEAITFDHEITLYEGVTARGTLKLASVQGLQISFGREQLCLTFGVSGGWEERVYSLPGLELVERHPHARAYRPLRFAPGTFKR